MVVLADAAVVAILTRAPSSGGKSRLFRSLGCDPDPALPTALLLDTVDAAAAPGVRRVVVVDPPDACASVRQLVHDVDVIPQAAGTLGERMAGAFHDLLAEGARAVVLIGSDLPDLPTRLVSDAFAWLEREPDTLVLGPSRDGGYYLIGATTVPPVFDGVAWGTGTVLEQTRELARRADVRVRLLEAVEDVDTRDELVRVRARRTMAWVRQHGRFQKE